MSLRHYCVRILAYVIGGSGRFERSMSSHSDVLRECFPGPYVELCRVAGTLGRGLGLEASRSGLGQSNNNSGQPNIDSLRHDTKCQKAAGAWPTSSTLHAVIATFHRYICHCSRG